MSKHGRPLDRGDEADLADDLAAQRSHGGSGAHGGGKTGGGKTGGGAKEKKRPAVAAATAPAAVGANGRHTHLPAHALNVFLPLVDITPANGGAHQRRRALLAPQTKQILSVHFRTCASS